MTFFYDLNKKLDSIREKPETTHKQLNERDMSRAAKGYEKYGKEGMEALAKAGREGKALDPVRKKYDKYDESVEEGSTGDYSAKKARAGKDIGKPGKNFEKIAKSAGERYGSKERGEKVAGAVLNKLRHPKEGIEDRIGDLDMTNPVNQPTYQRKAAAQGGSQKDFPRFSGGKKPADMPKSHEGFPRFSGGSGYTGKGVPADESVIYDIGAGIGGAVKSGAKKALAALNPNKPKKPTYPPLPRGYEGSGQEKADWDKFTGRGDYEESAAMTPKQKKFAALAEPKDKITFADKIAGAKKEVDEMLGDVAAEAMKAALSPKQKKIDMNKNGKLDANDFAMLRKGGKQETDEGWDDMVKDVDRRRMMMKKGEKIQGHKGEIEKTDTGIRHTRRYDDRTGETDTGDDTPASGEKRGRGRPKGTKAAIGAKGPSGKSKLMTKEGGNESDDIKQAMAMLKKAGYKVTKDAGAAEELDEKAVSKKQQRFMGMVHATQKGEKAPSKEVAKVAKSMGKKDAEDFASTKHKGLPEKKKPEGKKKEKTEEAGGSGTPTASSGFSYGKGIYDSLNRELEQMISEGMNVSMNMNSDANGGPSKSLTVTATDEDALKLSELLKNAGLGGNDQGYGGNGYKSACGCGTSDCSCGKEEMDEAYGDTTPAKNAPDYPTNTETSDDALQYSGGLNKPKSTGQTTTPIIHTSDEERQYTYAEAEQDDIKRMMEMAGIDEGVHTTLSTYRVKGQDLIDYLSNESGAEMEVHDGPDGPVGILTVDNITFPQLSRLVGKLAAEKKIQPIAGPATRDMTGKATTVGTKYIQSPEVAEGDDLARMMEMAGIREAKKPDANKDGIPDYAQDGKGSKDLGKAKEKKVDEGILSATANLWKEYKGQYGV